MNNILIPTDFSKCADDALDFGIEYAKKTNASISLLHIFRTALDWVNIPISKEGAYPEIQEQILDAKHKLKARGNKIRNNGLRVDEQVVFNTDYLTAFKNTVLHHYDMIIMGSHGASGFKELALGSNAMYLIKEASIPVFIIKEAISKPIGKIVFLSDYRDSFVKSFPILFEFANHYESEIDLLYVSQEAFPSTEKENTIALGMNRIQRYFPMENPYAKHIIYHDDVEEATREYCDKNNVDMISLVSTKKGMNIFNFFQSSISQKITNHSSLPILILRTE